MPYQGAICFLCIIYTYFRLPEPNGRSFAELDLLFERGISARKFASTKVDVFDDDVSVESTSAVKNYDEKVVVGAVEKDVEAASS